MSNAESELTTVEWKNTNWRKLERIVFKLQKRIYQASQRGSVSAVRRLQKTLMKSWSAKTLAVRRVTQDNQGKKTAGIDGIKNLTPKQRQKLVEKLSKNRKAKPVRRVWIDKPGKTEKRPLGIPTMHDRAAQALVKAALEPEWEAKFELNSYGFRPGRSCHDAIAQIFNSIKYKPKFVLDADIASCFDKINHEALLDKINTFPTMRRLIKSWLKAGVVDWDGYANRKSSSPTTQGTPQGGVISPLLANIALHGMENRLKQYAETLPGGKQQNRRALAVIRYADDFVILHEDLAVVNTCKQIVSDWLKDMGLELKPSKTHISHTLNEYEGRSGFDFLGFTVRQSPVGKYRTGHNPQGIPLGYKTIITPSQEKVRLHTDKIGTIIKQHKDAPKAALIARLNPVIRGWSNYYATVVCKRIFQSVDHSTFQQLMGWANHRHQTKTDAINNWKSIKTRNWVFATNDGLELIDHADTPKVEYIKVISEKSPFDGDWVYWSTRRGQYPGTPKRVTEILKKQKGKCSHCGLYFNTDSLLEIHHVDNNHKNNKKANLTMLHRHCHDTAHATREQALVEETDDCVFQLIP